MPERTMSNIRVDIKEEWKLGLGQNNELKNTVIVLGCADNQHAGHKHLYF